MKNVYDVEIAFVEGFVTKLVANSTNKYSKKYAWIHTDMIKNNHADDNYSNFEEHKKIYSKFDTIFSVSEYVKEVFIEKFGNEFKEKTKIQYNPVDSQEIEKLAQKPINDQYEKQAEETRPLRRQHERLEKGDREALGRLQDHRVLRQPDVKRKESDNGNEDI